MSHQPSENSGTPELAVAKKQMWISLVSTIFSFIALIAVLHAIQQTKQSINVATEGVKESRRATIAANRAWIYPHDFSFNNFKSRRLFIKGKSENVGHEAAGSLEFSTATIGFVSNEGNPIANIYAESHEDVCAPYDDDIGEAVFPGQQIKYARQYTFSNEDPRIGATLSGKLGFYFKDCAIYMSFGQLHHSAFCFWMRKNVLGEMETVHCPGGNWAD